MKTENFNKTENAEKAHQENNEKININDIQSNQKNIKSYAERIQYNEQENFVYLENKNPDLPPKKIDDEKLYKL